MNTPCTIKVIVYNTIVDSKYKIKYSVYAKCCA